jgi:CRISPR-associated protein Cmr5
MASERQNTPTGTIPVPQRRPRHALERIEDLNGKPPGNYVSYVKALPATIIKNGLGQAIAMELMGAQKDDGHKRLYQDCEQWLCAGWSTSPIRRPAEELNNRGALIKAIVASDADTCVRLQIETLEYLSWLKKFAVAFLEKKGPNEASEPRSQEPQGDGA